MQDSVRVLIAQGPGEDPLRIAEILAAEPGMLIVGTAVNSDVALALAARLVPDVILLNLAIPGSGGIELTETLAREMPEIPIIMLSDHPDAVDMRRAMRAGARDFLTTPLLAADLIMSVRGVHQQEQERLARLAAVVAAPPPAPKGKVICVYSPKGGVGRTAVAVNLAIALHTQSGKEVAIVDGSLAFGDVGVMLNLTSTKTIADLVPSSSDLSPEILDSVLVKHSSGVRVLLAPARPEGADLVHPEHIHQILTALQREYDYVVVDTWPSFHEVILAIFDVSNVVLLLTTLDMTAVKNLRLFLDVWKQLHYSEDRILLVLNRSDSTGGLRPVDIETGIQHKVAAGLVSAGPLVTSSINLGIPFILSDPRAPISRNINELASRLLTPEDGAVTGAPRSGSEKK